MRRRLLFFIIYLTLITNVISIQTIMAKNADIPTVAIYTFEPTLHTKEGVNFAAVISELLKISLSQSEDIALLDRTLLFELIQEKKLPTKKGEIASQGFDKIPLSKYVVVGKLLNVDSKNDFVVRVVESNTARIVGNLRVKIDEKSLQRSLINIDLFIHNSISKDRNYKSKNLKNIAIGSFINMSSDNSTFGRGVIISETLIDRYVNNSDFTVLLRTQMYPLLLEAHLHRLQFNENNKDIKRPVASIYVTGRYGIEGNASKPIRLILSLQPPVQRTSLSRHNISRILREESWNDIYSNIIKVVSKTIPLKAIKINPEQRKKAERLYQKGLKAGKMWVTKRGRHNGKPWLYPILQWGEVGKRNFVHAIKPLQEAIKLNPLHDKARVILASYFLKLNNDRKEDALHTLEMVMLRTDIPPLAEAIDSILNHHRLNNNAFTSADFEGITDDSKALFSELVTNSYVDLKDDKIYGAKQPSEASDIDLPESNYTEEQIRFVFYVLKKLGSDISDKEAFFTSYYYKFHTEAMFHFYHGERLSEIKYRFGHGFPKFDATKIAGKNTGILRSERLNNMIDHFSTAVLLEPKLTPAIVYLAYSLRAEKSQRRFHSDMWFEYVTKNSSEDEWKFIAGQAINKLAETNFSGDYARRVKRKFNISPVQENKKRITIPSTTKSTSFVETAIGNNVSTTINHFIPRGEGSVYTHAIKIIDDIAFIGEAKARPRAWGGSSLQTGRVRIYQRNNNQWTYISRLVGDEPTWSFKSKDWFGASIDVDNDYVIIGAPRDDGVGILKLGSMARSILHNYNEKALIEKLFEKGYIDIYNLVTNKFTGMTKRLRTDFGELNEEELSGLVRMLKGTSNVSDTGAAYIFRRVGTDWLLDGKLIASDAALKNRFGFDVAIHKDTALVCAEGSNTKKTITIRNVNRHSGGAYLYKKLNGQWQEVTKLIHGACNSVALGKDMAVVGIQDTKTGRGTVHAFTRRDNTWQISQEITVGDFTVEGWSFYNYGHALELSGDTLVIGNPGDQYGNRKKWGYSPGSAYIFRNVNQRWKLSQKLTVKGLIHKTGRFGTSISLSDRYLLIGAPNSSGGPDYKESYHGKAYLFKYTNSSWRLKETYSSFDSKQGASFSSQVATHNNSVIISTRKRTPYTHQISQ